MKYFIVRQAGELKMLTEDERIFELRFFDTAREDEIILEHDFKDENEDYHMGFFRALILIDEKYNLTKK